MLYRFFQRTFLDSYRYRFHSFECPITRHKLCQGESCFISPEIIRFRTEYVVFANASTTLPFVSDCVFFLLFSPNFCFFFFSDGRVSHSVLPHDKYGDKYGSNSSQSGDSLAGDRCGSTGSLQRPHLRHFEFVS